MNTKITTLFFLFLILPVIIFVRVPIMFPSDSAGDVTVFAYMGDMILKGQIPYRDMWDHKTPMIYYLNALMFKLFGSRFETIVLFELFWLFVSCLFIKKLSDLIFEQKVSLCLTLIFACYISSPMIAVSFGMVGIYSILPSIIAIFSIIKYGQGQKKIFLFISGLMAAVAFLFKQTRGVVILPIILYLGIQHFRRRDSFFKLLLEYSIFVMGVLIPISAFAIYFFINNALNDAISQILTYNLFYYTKGNVISLLNVKNLIISIVDSPILSSPLLYGGPFLLIFGIVGILYSRINAITIMLCTLFLLDIYTICLSKRFYNVYYLEIIPSLVLLSGYSLCYFIRQRDPTLRRRLICLLAISFLLSSTFLKDIFETFIFIRDKGCKASMPIAEWISNNTSESDFVYAWAGHPSVNFFAKRKVPTRYMYFNSLCMRGYVKDSDLKRFLSELKQNEPKFIIHYPLTAEHDIDSLRLSFPNYVSDNEKLIIEIFEFLNNNYVYAVSIKGYDIFKFQESRLQPSKS